MRCINSGAHSSIQRSHKIGHLKRHLKYVLKKQSSILKGFKNGRILTIKLQIKLLMKNEVKRIPIKHLDFVVHA